MRPTLTPALTLAAALAASAAAAAPVTYEAAGRTFEGWREDARGPSRGLVMIVHDWDGLTDYEKKRAGMLAELGYDAFAVDLFGAGVRPETMEGRRAETGRLYGDRSAMREILAAGLSAARAGADRPVVVMGYCFGGAATLEMARNGAPGVVGWASFHGGGATPEGQAWPKDVAPILILHGGADQGPTMAEVAQLSVELEAAGAPYQIEVYAGAPHAFTVFGSDRYREVADAKSWAAFREFLGERFAD